ncbi:uncharacterized protein LOC132732121 [Ruditapes philippinarum]|uniref:uncharacterized protein LOC132732121 n=1 Tax=Ruditapes philippinarum TaxID=129788 RepID=UPI00295B264E|nr:uncharacterized protein LOC132732121 [Ruditapes philippinarum]
MAARRRHDRKMRRSDITAYRTFTDNFILTPNENFLTDARIRRHSKEHNRTFPVLKVGKSTGTRWKVDVLSKLRGFPNIQMQHPSRLAREDTYDADYMMPSQVREILEEEGLENNVINGVIGQSEEKHKNALIKMKQVHDKGETKKEHIFLPPIVTTQKPVLKYNGMGSSSWLDLAARQHSHEQTRRSLWKNPVSNQGKDESWNYSHRMRSIVEDVQLEADRKKWVAEQHVEQLYTGDNFNPPRIVLVSSKIPKCYLLTKVYNDNVIPILYDFDSCTFTDILETMSRKLNQYKQNCKAKSVMVLCQGGPGYIYLLKNFAITPQKLYKPSYRSVLGFWRALANMISKLNPEDAAIHLFGFNLTENEQGKKIIPMLQSLMYPNLVKVNLLTEDTEAGRTMIGNYFRYNRLQVWKSYQKSSLNDIDFVKEETGPVKRHYRGPVMRLAR